MTETTTIDHLPKCDFCREIACYDGETRHGPWAYMCDEHFKRYGIGLGCGCGQRLKLREAGK